MVVAHTFQGVFEACAKTTALSLPLLKEKNLKIEFGNFKNNNIEFSGSELPLPFAASEAFHTTIVDWRRLAANEKECKDVYEVTFDLKGSNFTYKPGDTIGIIPKNNESEVNFLINHLNLTPVADSCYTLSVDNNKNCTKSKIALHIPISSNIRHVLTHCVDIRAVVKKVFLLALSRCTKDETERKVLEYLCSKEGSAAYTMYILNMNTCLLDLLANFKSCEPSIEILFQHLPRLLPRPYSIVNSPYKDPNVLKICFSVMSIGNNRRGLTTGWMENIILNQEQSFEYTFNKLCLTDNQNIPIYLRKNINCFCLPEKMDKPLILIGPGTGVAPHIGFLEQLEYLKTENKDQLYNVWLFFGCRHPKLDFIYQEELNRFIETKILCSLITAFSRYENYEIKYVQDAIMDNGENIVKLIKDGCSILVCGDVKTMATEVKHAFVNCLVKYDGRTIEEAEKLIYDLQKDKFYIVDIWN